MNSLNWGLSSSPQCEDYQREKYSHILQSKAQKGFGGLFGRSKEVTLCYRATDNGFEAGDFNMRCIHKENLVIIFKTTDNKIAGGFTDI